MPLLPSYNAFISWFFFSLCCQPCTISSSYWLVTRWNIYYFSIPTFCHVKHYCPYWSLNKIFENMTPAPGLHISPIACHSHLVDISFTIPLHGNHILTVDTLRSALVGNFILSYITTSLVGMWGLKKSEMSESWVITANQSKESWQISKERWESCKDSLT